MRVRFLFSIAGQMIPNNQKSSRTGMNRLGHRIVRSKLLPDRHQPVESVENLLFKKGFCQLLEFCSGVHHSKYPGTNVRKINQRATTVIPAKAGIQKFLKFLDSGSR
jgi:hypothetical protein